MPLKQLTTPELAQLVNANAPFKRRLADELALRMPVLEAKPVFEILSSACDSLVQSQGPRITPIRYRLVCVDCELDRVVEITTAPEHIKLKVTCCGCGQYSSFGVPRDSAVIACKHCGQETKVERLRGST